MQAIRQWLRSKGFTINFSERDILDMLRKAEAHVGAGIRDSQIANAEGAYSLGNERRALAQTTIRNPRFVGNDVVTNLHQFDIHNADGKKVGITAVGLADGKPYTLAHIEIVASERGKGYAESVVADLIQQAGGELGIFNIQPDAIEFWQKMGVTLDEGNDWTHGNGSATASGQRASKDARRASRDRRDASGNVGTPSGGSYSRSGAAYNAGRVAREKLDAVARSKAVETLGNAARAVTSNPKVVATAPDPFSSLSALYRANGHAPSVAVRDPRLRAGADPEVKSRLVPSSSPDALPRLPSPPVTVLPVRPPTKYGVRSKDSLECCPFHIRNVQKIAAWAALKMESTSRQCAEGPDLAENRPEAGSADMIPAARGRPLIDSRWRGRK